MKQHGGYNTKINNSDGLELNGKKTEVTLKLENAISMGSSEQFYLSNFVLNLENRLDLFDEMN